MEPNHRAKDASSQDENHLTTNITNTNQPEDQSTPNMNQNAPQQSSHTSDNRSSSNPGEPEVCRDWKAMTTHATSPPRVGPPSPVDENFSFSTPPTERARSRRYIERVNRTLAGLSSQPSSPPLRLGSPSRVDETFNLSSPAAQRSSNRRVPTPARHAPYPTRQTASTGEGGEESDGGLPTLSQTTPRQRPQSSRAPHRRPLQARSTPRRRAAHDSNASQELGASPPVGRTVRSPHMGTNDSFHTQDTLLLDDDNLPSVASTLEDLQLDVRSNVNLGGLIPTASSFSRREDYQLGSDASISYMLAPVQSPMGSRPGEAGDEIPDGEGGIIRSGVRSRPVHRRGYLLDPSGNRQPMKIGRSDSDSEADAEQAAAEALIQPGHAAAQTTDTLADRYGEDFVGTGTTAPSQNSQPRQLQIRPSPPDGGASPVYPTGDDEDGAMHKPEAHTPTVPHHMLQHERGEFAIRHTPPPNPVNRYTMLAYLEQIDRRADWLSFTMADHIATFEREGWTPQNLHRLLNSRTEMARTEIPRNVLAVISLWSGGWDHGREELRWKR